MPAVEWRTDDLSLAAFLRMEGHRTVRVEIERTGRLSIGYIVFNECDSLFDDVEDYISGAARVEPREYSRTYGHLKKAVYKEEGKRSNHRREDERLRREEAS